MWSNVIYFSTWQPHGNRVSKTRSLTLINIREEPREKKKKKTQKQREKNPGHAPCMTWVAGQAARGPGRVRPRLGRALPGFFSPKSPPHNSMTYSYRIYLG